MIFDNRRTRPIFPRGALRSFARRVKSPFSRPTTAGEEKKMQGRYVDAEQRRKKAEYDREYRKRNRDHARAYHRKWRKKNRKHILERLREHRRLHRDEVRAYMKKYADNHRDHLRTYHRAYYQKHREKFRASMKKWHRKNREKVRESSLLWYKNNKHFVRDATRKMKLRVKELLGGKCGCCGVSEMEVLTVDHVFGRKSDPAASITSGRGRDNTRYYKKILKAFESGVAPREYALLCFNCNYSKYRGGVCFHKRPVTTAREA